MLSLIFGFDYLIVLNFSSLGLSMIFLTIFWINYIDCLNLALLYSLFPISFSKFKSTSLIWSLYVYGWLLSRFACIVSKVDFILSAGDDKSGLDLFYPASLSSNFNYIIFR